MLAYHKIIRLILFDANTLMNIMQTENSLYMGGATYLNNNSG